MTRTEIMPEGLFDSTERGYTHAAVVDGTLYLSGQVATDEEGDVVGDDAETQTRRAFENVGLVLDEVDRGFGDVAKITSYLVDLRENYDGFKAAFAEFYDGPYPCHTMLGVDALAREAYLVELEVEVPLAE